ncbi:MAG: IS4 family transposase [Anaerolineae bacterium]|nr:IS4 family transposase [Anaerolineae bacterium]MCQ3977142.1 IS4 family transposase [Anaerolineae bacterium]
MSEPTFKASHRTAAKYFSRERILTFPLMLLLILRKSAKSLQVVLNEFFNQLQSGLVSKSAFSQARSHLRHTAFIELNQRGLVEVYYGDGEYQRYWGFRVLAIDGSKVILPDNLAVYAEFGTVKRPSGRAGQAGSGQYSYALASVVYDVLNGIALDSRLGDTKAYEIDLAEQHLAATEPDDLLVCDRNYPSYCFVATLVDRHRHFVIRCSRSSFAQVRAMFRGSGTDSQLVTLRPHSSQRVEIRRRGLPLQLTVRLVRLTLANGDTEILITDLLDSVAYPTAEFGPLYHHRWGVETFYGRLKTRLGLENFSGTSVEAIKQDFFATVFITGLESVLTDTAQAQLAVRSSQTDHLYQVNRVVSFNTIKNHVLELFYTQTDEDVLFDKLTALFLTSPSCSRPERVVPRRSRSAWHLLTLQRRKKKICF